MNRAAVFGIVLVVLGVAAFVVRQITYTDREEVLDIGPIGATAETQETVSVPPWIGGVLLGVGVILIAVGSARRA